MFMWYMHVYVKYVVVSHIARNNLYLLDRVDGQKLHYSELDLRTSIYY